jgi:hypothetical protein
MKTKLIITESQYNRLIKPLLNESLIAMVLDEIVSDLDKNYERVTATIKNNHDYVDKPRFKVLVHGGIITAKELLDYMKYKYHDKCGEDFLIQTIDDWYYKKIKNSMLSKNITLW